MNIKKKLDKKIAPESIPVMIDAKSEKKKKKNRKNQINGQKLSIPRMIFYFLS